MISMKKALYILIIFLLASCARGGLDSNDISALVRGLAEGNPPVTSHLNAADMKVRLIFLDHLRKGISNSRDCSACAMFSRIDEADEVFDEIIDGEYRATLVWHRGGEDDGEELLRKVFIQDSETGAWRQVSMEPYHSAEEYRYAVTELSYNGDIPRRALEIVEGSGMEFPLEGLRSVSYSYNHIQDKSDGSEMRISDVVMMNYITADYDAADIFISEVNSRNSSAKIVMRASRVDERLSVMLMLP